MGPSLYKSVAEGAVFKRNSKLNVNRPLPTIYIGSIFLRIHRLFLHTKQTEASQKSPEYDFSSGSADYDIVTYFVWCVCIFFLPEANSTLKKKRQYNRCTMEKSSPWPPWLFAKPHSNCSTVIILLFLILNLFLRWGIDINGTFFFRFTCFLLIFLRQGLFTLSRLPWSPLCRSGDF